jgi:lipoyl(octanoyl) transferase
MTAAGELWVCHLGRVAYRDGLALQERVRDAREADRIPDTLLLLEHDPVYTRGRRTEPGELPLGAEWYAERGIEIVDVDRGGRVTHHAPGQLVGYPIVRTHAVVDHVRGMERAMIAALGEAGVVARSRSDEGPDFTGVWVGDRKIASIGVHVRRGITTHGFAVNVVMDLEPWTWIVPCGLAATMTSIAAETGGTEDVACFRKRMAHAYARELGVRQRIVTPARLDGVLDGLMATPASG